jgi:hypothetical protein
MTRLQIILKHIKAIFISLWMIACIIWAKLCEIPPFLKILRRLWGLRESRTWVAANSAVKAVMADRNLTNAAQGEPYTSFCPRCGQIPDGDRRMEEAREIALSVLKKDVKRRDLDLALAFHYWFERL